MHPELSDAIVSLSRTCRMAGLYLNIGQITHEQFERFAEVSNRIAKNLASSPVPLDEARLLARLLDAFFDSHKRAA